MGICWKRKINTTKVLILPCGNLGGEDELNKPPRFISFRKETFAEFLFFRVETLVELALLSRF
jgi:hypothetical protein